MQIMVVKKFIIRIFMGGYRSRIAGPGVTFENHRTGCKTCGASYWNGSRIRIGIKYAYVIMPANIVHRSLAGNDKFSIALLLNFNKSPLPKYNTFSFQSLISYKHHLKNKKFLLALCNLQQCPCQSGAHHNPL